MRALAILVLLATTARADDRIARALAAVHDLGPRRDTLERELRTAAREKCHADRATPAVACLVAAATDLCKHDATCEAAADVMITNARAANDWVDEATRMRLVRGSADYQTALSAELHRRFAALAAELALTGGRDIAALCRKRDDLPWSRCVAALVWFVGAAP